jgi:putative intracellular protease/amidase
MNLLWINEHGSPVETTAKVNLTMTEKTSFKEAPHLDILLIPGGNPHHQQTPSERAFICKATDDPATTAVMSICTGANILAASGALNGKNGDGAVYYAIYDGEGEAGSKVGDEAVGGGGDEGVDEWECHEWDGYGGGVVRKS